MIELFSQLGERLATFGRDPATEPIIERAIADNEWFTREDICHAVEAIRCDMLQSDMLRMWAEQYPTCTTPRRVAVIMAGNIPLVGFFDLMCVVASGNACYVKPSSKDRVLMRYVIALLRDIKPDVAIYDFTEEESYDMLIATGGDAAIEYFDRRYPTTRRLLRGSRHSIAVLDGSESYEELRNLAHDITAYSGLGCRSVSLLFVPRGRCPKIDCSTQISSKRQRNLVAERALRRMQGRAFVDCGGFILERGRCFPTSLSVVSFMEYDSLADVEQWIAEHGSELQCVVSHISALNHSLPFGRVIDFGKAQHPTLNDYADGIDTMAWLCDDSKV